MNHLMAQNPGISYPNMMNYPMNIQPTRPIDPSNPIQYAFPQSQTQRILPLYFKSVHPKYKSSIISNAKYTKYSK